MGIENRYQAARDNSLVRTEDLAHALLPHQQTAQAGG
jgi:hypothetical protein